MLTKAGSRRDDARVSTRPAFIPAGVFRLPALALVPRITSSPDNRRPLCALALLRLLEVFPLGAGPFLVTNTTASARLARAQSYSPDYPDELTIQDTSHHRESGKPCRSGSLVRLARLAPSPGVCAANASLPPSCCGRAKPHSPPDYSDALVGHRTRIEAGLHPRIDILEEDRARICDRPSRYANGRSVELDSGANPSTPRSEVGGLLPSVYAELRQLAHRWFRSQPADHTLDPTALVHEAYLRLAAAEPRDRTHFVALAATAMRQILVSHARRRNRLKRGGGWQRVALAGVSDDPGNEIDLEALQEALTVLERLHPRHARLVDLRYFGGLSIDECARVFGIAPRTVKLDWQMARAWLLRRIES